MRIPSEDEVKMAHVIAYNYAEARHKPMVGAPRINWSGCNYSHRHNVHCMSCFWNGCQECGKESETGFTGWTGLCDKHSHMQYMVSKVPDGLAGFYIEDPTPSGAAAFTAPSGAAAPGPSASGAFTAPSASVAAPTSSSVAAASSAYTGSTGGASKPSTTPASQTGGTPTATPSAAPPSSKGKNRATTHIGSVSIAGPSSWSSPIGASSSMGGSSSSMGGSSSSQGGSSAAKIIGGIVIKPDPDAIVISSEDEDNSPEAAVIRMIRRKFPQYPRHFIPPAVGEHVYTIGFHVIGTGNFAHKPEWVERVYNVFMEMDQGIKESQAYPPHPPSGFSRGTPAFSVGDIIQVQHFGQEQQFLIAVERVKARNQVRSPDEQVPDDTIVVRFAHGTTVRNAKSVVIDGVRQVRNAMHRFGKGLYGSNGLLSTPVNYALGRTDDTPALLLGDVIAGRATEGRQDLDVPPPGYDSVGSGDKWVHVVTDPDMIRYRYIVKIRQESSFFKWDQQLQDIKDQRAKMLEEEAAKAKAKAQPAGAMDLSDLMASVDAAGPPGTDPKVPASSVDAAEPPGTDPKVPAPSTGGPSTAKAAAKPRPPPAKSNQFLVTANGMSASISISGGASVTVTNGSTGNKRKRGGTVGASVTVTNGAGDKKKQTAARLPKNARVKFTVGGAKGGAANDDDEDVKGDEEAKDEEDTKDDGAADEEEEAEEEKKYKSTPENSTEDDDSTDSSEEWLPKTKKR